MKVNDVRKPKMKVRKWGRPVGVLQSEETKRKISESVKKAYQKHLEEARE